MDEETLVLAIQSKPMSDTSPEELIRLKGRGVTQPVLKAMLSASQAAPAAPVPPEPPPPLLAQQAQANQGPVGAWVGIMESARGMIS